MNGHDHPRGPRIEPDPELARKLAALERPAARPQFRAELRERFLAAAADAPQSARARAERATPDASPARRNLVFLAAGLAAAAAIVLTVFLARPRPAVWRVEPGTSATAVMIDGLALRTDEVERIVQALVAAREVEVAGGTLRLAVRGEALLELGPGTRLAQMKFAPAGPYQAKVERGSLGVATLAPFGRRGMRVLTEDFEVTVAGTAFIVDIDATGSCVCVLEGRVRCDPTGDEPSREVEAGGLGFARRDRAPATWGPAHADHLEPLRELVSATNAGG